MAVQWALRSYLAAKHGLYRPVDVQKTIVKRTGVMISLQNLCNLLTKKPKTIRLATMEVICSAFSCTLDDFCGVKPKKMRSDSVKKLSFANTPHSKRAIRDFPEPKDYDE